MITSNLQSIRLYIDKSTEYEEFNLFEMADGREASRNLFARFFLIFNSESILNHLPETLKQQTRKHEEEITQKLYNDYQAFKDRIFENLQISNSQYDNLTLFKKAQKLLDRFLFIFFAEDSGLIPPNSASKTIEVWDTLKKNLAYQPLYARFQLFFKFLDKGYDYPDWGKIPAYNGGLFQYDEILDNPELKLPDGLLKNHVLKISAYDFNSEVDVNILGHIFEHSLSEIEEIEKQLTLPKPDTLAKFSSKRKKDGIFYTPKHITKYIVENTVGILCEEKKSELEINNFLISNDLYLKTGKLNKKGRAVFETLQTYKKWLFTLKIIDPACGSGAFLNATLDFLIAEHKQTDDLISELTGEKIGLFDTDKTILENNIFGVDINEESVEIAKLSLWLRTARPGRVLSDLSGNIKCGNSLIDDPKIAGEKAFDWNTEFEQIMSNGGFDVVLGNPPYRIVFETDIKEFLEKTYPAFRRNNDLYVAFIQRTFQLVKKLGYISFITPNTYIRGSYFKTLRSELIKKQILQIVDFGNKTIFVDANVFTAIICLQNTKQHSGWLMKKSLTTEKGYVKANTTNFIAKNGLFLKLSKFEKFDKYFLIKDVGYNYWSKGRGKKRGQGSIGDRVFYSGELKNKNDIPYLKGSQVFRYCNSEPINFLRHNYKEFLEDNDTFRFTPEILETNPKIIYRQTASKIVATIDYNSYHNDKTVHCIISKNENNINLKYVLTLLNSSLLNYYYSVLTEEGGRVFAQVKTVNIKNLPFTFCNKQTQDLLIEKADQMLLLNKSLLTEKNNFIQTLKDHKNLEKISRRLENFNEVDFAGLIKEIGKQKARFALGQETNEWRQYFNSTKQKVNEIQAQINQTDREIDNMIYQLYELTPEEIEIVENATNE